MALSLLHGSKVSRSPEILPDRLAEQKSLCCGATTNDRRRSAPDPFFTQLRPEADLNPGHTSSIQVGSDSRRWLRVTVQGCVKA
jgi:hypothetical protein